VVISGLRTQFILILIFDCRGRGKFVKIARRKWFGFVSWEEEGSLVLNLNMVFILNCTNPAVYGSSSSACSNWERKPEQEWYTSHE